MVQSLAQWELGGDWTGAARLKKKKKSPKKWDGAGITFGTGYRDLIEEAANPLRVLKCKTYTGSPSLYISDLMVNDGCFQVCSYQLPSLKFALHIFPV